LYSKLSAIAGPLAWGYYPYQLYDHAMDEEFRGRWPSHLEQFTSRSANRNSLPSDVRSISEGPPVWLIDSASEGYLWRALQIHSSSSSPFKRISFRKHQK